MYAILFPSYTLLIPKPVNGAFNILPIEYIYPIE